MTYCLNCNSTIHITDTFCSSCGQATKQPRLSVWSLVKDFLSNLFNLESKLFQTIRDLFVPGKLTLSYIAGKRIRYYNPIRMFLIVLALFFTVLFFLLNDTIDKSKDITNKVTNTINNSIIVEKLDSFAMANNLNEELSYDLRCNIITEALSPTDSIYFDESIIQIGNINSGFNTIEFFTSTPEELIEQYEIDDRLTQLTIIQGKRFIHSPSESIRHIIGNGTWVIISTILLLSLFFKLFYRNYHFAEHIVFHIIGHTRMLLLSAILLLLNALFIGLASGVVAAILIPAGLVYLYLGLKTVYLQKAFTTWIKWCLSLILYSIILLLMFFATSILSFYIF